MKEVSEIVSNTKLHVLTNKQLDDQIKITAYFFNPVDRKRWYVIFTRGFGWEHLSISQGNKTPTWDVMCMVKEIFWGDDEVCVEFHPKKEDYINMHEHCLHIWKPIGVEIPTPPPIMVGIAGVTPEENQNAIEAYLGSLSEEQLIKMVEDRGVVINREIRRKAKM